MEFTVGLYPTLSWPVMLYEIPLTISGNLKQSINSKIISCMGLPSCLSSTAFYNRDSKLKLPLEATTTEFTKGKARVYMALRGLKDPVVRAVNPVLETGRKWTAAEEGASAERCRKHDDITAHGRSI